MFIIRILFILCFIGLIFCGNIKESYIVEGMHCQYGCANKVQSLIIELDGIEKCEVDFKTSTMIVEYDDSKVNSKLILSTLSDKTTYKSFKIEDKVKKQRFWNKIKKIFG